MKVMHDVLIDVDGQGREMRVLGLTEDSANLFCALENE